MGDLNYRCDWSIRTGKQHTVEEKIANVAKLVEANKFKELWAMDQLRQEREANRVLMGFQEGRYNFKPTFKMLREPGFKYKVPPLLGASTHATLAALRLCSP